MQFRPYLKEFLEDMRERYELVVYTSADQGYADVVIDCIESEQQFFAHRLYQAQCLRKEGLYLFKDLEILCSNRVLSDIVLVDNLVRNYSLAVRNGVPIVDYKGAFDDCQLVHLAGYLRKLASEPSLPEAINKDFAAFLLKHYEST